MARQGSNGRKTHAGAKAWAPELDAAGRPAGLLLPDGVANAAGWLRGLVSQWAAAEVAPGRLLPWLPVAFGLGIVAYFTADREPTWWATSTLALIGFAVTFLAHRDAHALRRGCDMWCFEALDAHDNTIAALTLFADFNEPLDRNA
jgi:competence protein ComEC